MSESDCTAVGSIAVSRTGSPKPSYEEDVQREFTTLPNGPTPAQKRVPPLMYYGWPVDIDWLADLAKKLGFRGRADPDGFSYIDFAMDIMEEESDIELRLQFSRDKVTTEKIVILSMCSTHNADAMPHSAQICPLIPYLGTETLGWYQDLQELDAKVSETQVAERLGE